MRSYQPTIRAGPGIASISPILTFHSAILSSVPASQSQSVIIYDSDIEEFKVEMEKAKAHNNTLNFNVSKADLKTESKAEEPKAEEKKTE